LPIPRARHEIAKEDLKASPLQFHQVIEAVDRLAPPLVVDPPVIPDGLDLLPAPLPDEVDRPSLAVASDRHRMGLV